MRTRVIAQPSEAIMGEIIKEHLSSQEPFFNKIWLVSAFANAQTIQRLAPDILAAKERERKSQSLLALMLNQLLRKHFAKSTRLELMQSLFIMLVEGIHFIQKFTCLKRLI